MPTIDGKEIPRLHPPTLELGGQTRTLVCDMGAWAKLKDLGYTVRQALAGIRGGDEMDFRIVQALLVAVLWKDKVTPEQVGTWVTGENFQDVMQALGQSLRHAFGEAEASEDPNPPSGIGSGSSSEALTAV